MFLVIAKLKKVMMILSALNNCNGIMDKSMKFKRMLLQSNKPIKDIALVSNKIEVIQF